MKNPNLSKEHNDAIEMAQLIADKRYEGYTAESAEKAKKLSFDLTLNGYSFIIGPTYREMIDGKDYGESQATVTNAGAMLTA